MPYSILLDSPSLVIGFDAVNEWVYADWRGPQNSETIKHGGEQLLYFLREKGCCKILNDNRHVAMPWTADGMEWVTYNLMPRLTDAGLQYMAWVHSTTHDGWRFIDCSLRSTTTTMVVAFEDLWSACLWLRHHCRHYGRGRDW
jgi:hypothetical protein